MVASRNQLHVMSRAFGSTTNGSLPAYGAVGEMETYLNGIKSRPMRGLGSGPKPNMRPKTQGELLESTDISTRFGWGAVFVVKDNSGYYVVEHYCPQTKSIVRDGKYPNAEEATAAANKVKYQLRNYGKIVTSLNGFNGYSNLGATYLGVEGIDLGIFALIYTGLGFPGAKKAYKYLSDVFDEPVELVQNTLLVIGLGALAIRNL